MSLDPSPLVATFVGALQGSISVLLTLFSGYLVGRWGVIDHSTTKRISDLCTLLFLPCLIVVETGPELTVPALKRLWIIPAWGLLSTLFAHLLARAGQRIFRFPHWTIVAADRPDSNSIPFLLLQSLQHTNVLDALTEPGEDVARTLARAQTYVLLNAVVQQTFTFQLGPAILARDRDVRCLKDDDPEDADRLGRRPAVVQDPERTAILSARDVDAQSYGTATQDGLSPAMRSAGWPVCISVLKKSLVRVTSTFSPPLIGALVALFLGMIGPLNHAFFDHSSPLYATITTSVENLGNLFAVLQAFIVGAELALVPSRSPGVFPSAYVLMIRFVIMPATSLAFVWATAGRGFYVDDRLVWFLLILLPSGPSAMLLIGLAELMDINQGPIAAHLTLSYLLSPLLAVVCSLGLAVVKNAEGRV